MAHAYTTKRGKNKKGKLGVRKDQQQNQERSLKNPILDAMKYDGDRENSFEIGRIGSSSARIEAIKSRLQKQLVDKCSNPQCNQPSSESRELSECASCRTVRYCGRDCQLAHWPDHKAICKEKKKELAARAEALAQLARGLNGDVIDELAHGLKEQSLKGAEEGNNQKVGGVSIAENEGEEEEEDDDEEEDEEEEEEGNKGKTIDKKVANDID